MPMSESDFSALETRLSHKWHERKGVQVGHILTTVAMAVSAILFITNMREDIAVLKREVLAQQMRDDKQDRDMDSALGKLSERLERIDAKMDRLLERRN